MTELEKRVQKISRPASSVKHSGKIILEVTRAEINDLNRTIEPKIKQNERERQASLNDARNVLFK